MSGSRTLWRFVRALSAHGDLPADLETFLAHAGAYRYPRAAEDPEERRRRVARDVRAEARSQQRQWLHDNLRNMEPQAGQRHDTHLGLIGLTTLAKRLRDVPSIALDIVNYEPLGWDDGPGGWLVTASGVVDRSVTEGLRKLGGKLLAQMHNRDLGVAGEVRSVRLDGNRATMICRIAKQAAAAVQKIKHQVYPMIELVHDGAGKILDVSLVDRPQGDELAKRGVTILAKLYRKKEEPVSKKLKKASKLARKLGQPVPVMVKRLPDAVEKALQERQRAEDRYNLQPNEFTRNEFVKADQAARTAAALAQVRPVGQPPGAPITSALGLLTARR